MMKAKYSILFFCIQLLFLAVACSDDDNNTVAERNDLVLSVNSESVILNEEIENEVALTFSWNKATDMGPDYTFTYLFQLDIAYNDFTTATDPIELGENTSVSFTHVELYDLIVEHWGKTAGEPVQLEARVAAKVHGPYFKYPEIAYSTSEVVTYLPVSQALYLLGTATEAGLDADKALKMTELSNGRLYNWKGSMKPGQFKFITTLGSMLPSYNKGGNNTTLVERTTEEEPDNCFEITEASTYYIFLSKKNMTISYKKVKHDNLYLIGDATAAGWELNKLIPMTPFPLNPNIFIYTGPLKAGEFKVLTGNDWKVPTYRPKKADATLQDTDLLFTASDDPDYKWKLSESDAGTYQITLDTETMTIKFDKSK